MTHAEFNATNPLTVKINWPDDEFSYVLVFQPKSFDWQERRAGPHIRGGGHVELLSKALALFELICGK